MNPSSIKTRFAYGFLRTLKKLNTSSSSSSSLSSPKEIFLRYQSVKMASDASMAYAVGPRRAWSRAMMRKIRWQAQARRRRRRRRRSSGGLRKRGDQRRNKLGGLGKFGELRDLVPGGEGMDLYRLLGETAHYIECLTTQVQVMKNIVDFCSSPT